MLTNLLKLYDKKVDEYLKDNGRVYHFNVVLTSDFLKVCRERIISGHERYGDDYKTKDNLMEANYEMYDLFNYLMLDAIQRYEKGLRGDL